MNSILACAGSITLLFGIGCSHAIYESGRYSEILKPGISRSEIRSELGPPLEVVKASGSENDFATSNRFIVEGPVYDSLLAADAAMSSAMTLGLFEIKNLPEAIFWKMSSSGACNLKIFYSAELKYRSHHISKVNATE